MTNPLFSFLNKNNYILYKCIWSKSEVWNMIKITTTKEVATKYKGMISIMRQIPRTNKVELYMGQSLYNKIVENEKPNDYELVYDTSKDR